MLKDGEVAARHAWGFANAELRIPFTPKTLFRVCSNTKQFVCALMLDAFPDPTALDADVRARLPRLEGVAPSALHLAHNQSGIRDYWAVAMLHGSPAEAAFGDNEARRVIEGTRSLHFAPGTRYSYANNNFRILGDILADRAGKGLAELLRERLFDPIGMESAFLAADTRAMPDGAEGYEGNPAEGFRPAENRIVWTGDAGMGASLDDMIAWERHIDDTRDDETSLYRRLSAPVTFADGAPARYGFGLGRGMEFGHATTGHGGGLRGWRSHRLHVASERISVVVMFNHLVDAYQAAADLLAAALGEDRPAPAPSSLPAPDWLGAYLEPETGLFVRTDRAQDGNVQLRHNYPPATLCLRPDGGAGEDDGVRLRAENDGVWLEKPGENARWLLAPLNGAPQPDVAGLYRCAELGAELTITDAGGVLTGGFSGFLGQGRMETLEPIGDDVWALPCLRSLDYTPPGDWTLAFFERFRHAGQRRGRLLARPPAHL